MESWEMCSEAAGEAENHSNKKTKPKQRRSKETTFQRFVVDVWSLSAFVLARFGLQKQTSGLLQDRQLSSGVTHIHVYTHHNNNNNTTTRQIKDINIHKIISNKKSEIRGNK